MSKYGVFSGPYFPVFGPEKTLYLDTFYAVLSKCNQIRSFQFTKKIFNGKLHVLCKEIEYFCEA